MAVVFTIEELARETGEPVPTVLEWRRLGLLGTDPPGPAELERARLVQFLVRLGVPAERIVELHGEIAPSIERYLRDIFPSGTTEVVTIDQAAERSGVPKETVERLADAMRSASDRAYFTPEDVSVLRWWGRAMAAGMPEDAVVQLIRVYREALGRVAEAEIRLFHFYVHEPLRAAGLEGAALREATDQRSMTLLPMIQPALAYFHRLGFARAEREDLLLHVGDQRTLDAPGRLAAGVVFTDLSSFTPLTEAMGDVSAAILVARFAEIVRAVTDRHAGRSVKQMGDGFMLIFFEAHAALAAALDIVADAGREPSFPAARCGVHWGDVIYRDGDYYGAAVNLAARMTDAAQRHQVVVSAAARERVADAAPVLFSPLGSRVLKGVLEPQTLFDARRSDTGRLARVRDVVCGMELEAHEVAVRLVLDGTERGFCSETCLRRFVAAPDRYPDT